MTVTGLNFSISWVEAGDHADGRTDRKVSASHRLEGSRRKGAAEASRRPGADHRCGWLGAPAALYLAAPGVGTISLVDADNVDLSNLQRQVIHVTPDIGQAKVASARGKMEAINPGIRVNAYQECVHAGNIAGIIRDYDFVIDGTDNFAAKFLINDACVLAEKPYSHAGILRFDGHTITVRPGGSACYRCIFPAPLPP